jgi:hypothetical protein
MLAFRVAAAAPFVSGSKGAGGCGVLPPRGLALGASGFIVGQQICDFVGSGGVGWGAFGVVVHRAWAH